MADLTPAELLAATAADMCRVADGTTPGPWLARPVVVFGGYEDGAEIEGFGGLLVADRASAGDACHIAAWDPDMARAVAAWLEAKAARYGQYDAEEQARIVETGTGTLAPMLAVCAAWWASRGVEPGAAT